jgi:hypothetical protein
MSAEPSPSTHRQKEIRPQLVSVKSMAGLMGAGPYPDHIPTAHFVKCDAAEAALLMKEKKDASPLLLVETSFFPRALQVHQGDYQLACYSALAPVLQNSPVVELKHDEALYIPDLDMWPSAKYAGRCSVLMMRPLARCAPSTTRLVKADELAFYEKLEIVRLCARCYKHDTFVLSDFGCQQSPRLHPHRMSASSFGSALNAWFTENADGSTRGRTFRHVVLGVAGPNLVPLQQAFLNPAPRVPEKNCDIQ